MRSWPNVEFAYVVPDRSDARPPEEISRRSESLSQAAETRENRPAAMTRGQGT